MLGDALDQPQHHRVVFIVGAFQLFQLSYVSAYLYKCAQLISEYEEDQPSDVKYRHFKGSLHRR